MVAFFGIRGKRGVMGDRPAMDKMLQQDERVLVKSEDWMPDTWVSCLLVLSGAGAGAGAKCSVESTRRLTKMIERSNSTSPACLPSFNLEEEMGFRDSRGAIIDNSLP